MNISEVLSRRFPGLIERHHSKIRMVRLYAYTFSRSASSMIGLVLVSIFLLLALISPWIVPFPEDATGSVHLDIKLQSRAGSNPPGRDRTLHCLWGIEQSIQPALPITPDYLSGGRCEG